MTQAPQITDADFQALLAINPLALEQIRRIIAERQLAELQAEVAACRPSSDGVAGAPDVAITTS